MISAPPPSRHGREVLLEQFACTKTGQYSKCMKEMSTFSKYDVKLIEDMRISTGLPPRHLSAALVPPAGCSLKELTRTDAARGRPTREPEERRRSSAARPSAKASSSSVPSAAAAPHVGNDAVVAPERRDRSAQASSSPPRSITPGLANEEPLIRETAANQMRKASVKELSELDHVGLYHSPGAAEVLCAILNQKAARFAIDVLHL